MSRDSVACVTTKPMPDKPLAQLFLAVHGLLLDELANGRRAGGASYLCVSMNQYTEQCADCISNLH